jgi:aminoglycoside phosphotransferase family enzyme
VDEVIQQTPDLTLAEKVAILSRPETYGKAGIDVACRETHMSWVFLIGDRVYKLKKPVRFPYLDFSTLEKRESACRAEARLNRRLAPDVYLNAIPVVARGNRLSIGGAGTVVDWLVAMRRLDEREMLDHLIAAGRVDQTRLDDLVTVLADFYRRAEAITTLPATQLAEWRRSLAYNRRVLLDPRLGMPSGRVQWLDRLQRRFLDLHGTMLAARVRARKIVDGHGDLRPEHIHMGRPVRIIDCIEFNPRLRAVDPYDEVAFLCLECERLGAPWISDYLKRRMAHALRGEPHEELFLFYRCHRATLRARLAIAHLLEPNPRTPEKWPKLARVYLALATKDALCLQRMIRKQEGRRVSRYRAAVGSSRQAAARRKW